MSAEKDTKRIILLPGDGIGPEVMTQSVKLLNMLGEAFNINFEYEECDIGGIALRKTGLPISDETLAKCSVADAVLLGTVGDDSFDENPVHLRPEYALVKLRTDLGAFCNLRSIRVRNFSPPNEPESSTVSKNVNMVVIQTLRNGYYFREYADNNAIWETTPDKANFSKSEISRVAKKAFSLACIRNHRLTAVTDTKSKTSSRLWRSVVEEMASEYPQIDFKWSSVAALEKAIVDNPFDLDVVFCESRFAPIINNAAEKLTESVGMLASACLGNGVGIYQPVNDVESENVGKNLANPIAMMNSIGLMLHYSFNKPLAASNIEEAVAVVLGRGYHTIDMPNTNGTAIGTMQMVNYVLEEVKQCLNGPILTV